MTPNDQPRPGAIPPPSFTPQSGRPPRPSTRESTIEVGDTDDGMQRAVPAGNAAGEPRLPTVRRTSSDKAGQLSDNAPRAGASGRIPAAAPRAATPPPARPARPVSGSRSAAASPNAGLPASSHAAQPVTDSRPAAFEPSVRMSRPGSGTGAPSVTPASRASGSSAAARTAAPAAVAAGSARAADRGAPKVAHGVGHTKVVGGGAPGGPVGPASAARSGPRWGRIAAVGVALLLVLAIAWPVGLLLWANGKINHIEALSGASDTPGTTYLLAGSDSRADGTLGDDGTTGARTDTIMVLHVPDSGPTSLISLPRDSYVAIPGNGSNKLNAAYSWGGAPLLVETVEALTGMTVDHYIEIGFSGVQSIVDAVGGVELCLDYDVNDELSGLVWTSGCHTADGTTALAFSRMRYADKQGDIGRAERQRQVIGAVTSALQDKSILVKPGTQRTLIGAGLDVLTVDDSTNIVDLGKMALAFRAANGADGVTGTPPLGSLDYRPGNVGSAVELDAERGPQFWADIRDGKVPAGVVGGLAQ